MSDTTNFYNKYVQVLKTRFDNAMNDVIHLETQLILAKEELENQKAHIESLESKLEKETAKNETKSTRRTTKDTE